MTVKDLIEKLQEYPSDLLVSTSNGYCATEITGIYKDEVLITDKEVFETKKKNYPYKRKNELGYMFIDMVVLEGEET